MDTRPAPSRAATRRLGVLASALQPGPAQQPHPCGAAPGRQEVLITDIKCYLEPFFMVKIETDQGTYGWGESGMGRNRGLAVKVRPYCLPPRPSHPPTHSRRRAAWP